MFGFLLFLGVVVYAAGGLMFRGAGSFNYKWPLDLVKKQAAELEQGTETEKDNG